jgi:hypothetical protein
MQTRTRSAKQLVAAAQPLNSLCSKPHSLVRSAAEALAATVVAASTTTAVEPLVAAAAPPASGTTVPRDSDLGFARPAAGWCRFARPAAGCHTALNLRAVTRC